MNDKLSILVDLIIIALAVWRFSNVISDDSLSGPWDVLHKLRYALGVRYNDFNEAEATTTLATAILCIYCSTFWFGLVAGIMYLFFGDIVVTIAIPIAIGSLAMRIGKGI